MGIPTIERLRTVSYTIFTCRYFSLQVPIDQPDVHYVGVSVSMRAYHGVPQTWLMFPSTTGMYLMNDLFSYQGSSAFFR